MKRYSVKPRYRIFVKSYEFLSISKNVGRNIGKNISKSLNSKYSQLEQLKSGFNRTINWDKYRRKFSTEGVNQ